MDGNDATGGGSGAIARPFDDGFEELRFQKDDSPL
jgi:hypothetical protein